MEVPDFLLPFAEYSGIAIFLVNFICMYLVVKKHAVRIFGLAFLAQGIIAGITYYSTDFYLAHYRSPLIFIVILSLIQSVIQYGAMRYFYPDTDRKRLHLLTLLAFCLSVSVNAVGLYILNNAPSGPKQTALRLGRELVEKSKKRK